MDLDLEKFECPICLSLFQGSIFQCKNGHVLCNACRSRIHGACPSCREPIGDIRNRALENIMAGMVLPCSFRSQGCTQLLKPTERRDHETFHFQHAPFACPFQGCAYSGLLLYDHIHDGHSKDSYVECLAGSTWWVGLQHTMPFRVLLDPVDRSVYMLLNGGGVRSGRSLSVVCLGPRPAANELLEYKMKVDINKPSATFSLSASGSMPCMRRWTGQYPTDGFLFVPDTYWNSFLHVVVVNVHVQKVGGRQCPT